MKKVRLTEETKKDLLGSLLKRSPKNYGEYESRVAAILDDVAERGDTAVFEYTKKYDGVDINKENIKVSAEEISAAYDKIDKKVLDVIKKAAANVRSFHEKQKRSSWFDYDEGIIVGQRIIPIETVGVYVPGGSAPLSSSVLMNIIPASVAGVKNINMLTPPRKDGTINEAVLVAADIAGADNIYKCGGSQAIAALAFGTESIPKADKIVGPGNIYVTLAKKRVFGNVGIDSIAGPSEILVIADETADPRFVAADLLSQAEHDPLASAILITTSEKLADEVAKEIDIFKDKLERKEIIEKSLENFGFMLVADNMEDAVAAANDIASEHLEIITKDPYDVMTRIHNAGAVFLGAYSSEPLGDYFAGPNHVLPTNGTAKFFSPLNVDDFVKKSSIISYSKEALEKVHEDIETFAKAEGLTAHANSVAVRFEK